MNLVPGILKCPLAIAFFAPFFAGAQATIEFANGSGPSASGPSTASQVITFQNNLLNPSNSSFTPYVPTLTATFSISNQQYTLPVGQSASGADVIFGGTVNGGGQSMGTFNLFSAMNGISSATNGNFSASGAAGTAGTGISTSSNYAVGIFNSAMGLYNAGLSTSGSHYMANITITFNKPITNPVLQIVGLGGTFGPGGPTALGLTSALTLTTPGVTLSKLSGSSELTVTSTQISNNAAHPTATTGSGAASGSILATGSGITSLSFKLYLSSDAALSSWSNASQHTGDAFLMGVSALSTSVTLPITLTSFNARAENATSLLNWSTAREEQTAHFDIQQRTGSTQWEKIGEVQAAGNSSQAENYQFVDKNPAAGTNYYRIVEYDLDGTPTYSQIAIVLFAEHTATTITVFPNPAVNQVAITTGDGSQRSVQLFSFSGALLINAPAYSSGQIIDISRYPKGMYVLVLRDQNGQTETRKIEKI